jgi:hypothetical protein
MKWFRQIFSTTFFEVPIKSAHLKIIEIANKSSFFIEIRLRNMLCQQSIRTAKVFDKNATTKKPEAPAETIIIHTDNTH